MATVQQQIEALEKKLAQAKERAKKMEAARKAKEAKSERSKDSRRKTLLGVAVLQAVKAGRMTEGQMLSLLDAGLTRDTERAVFGLPPRQAAAAAPEGGQLG